MYGSGRSTRKALWHPYPLEYVPPRLADYILVNIGAERKVDLLCYSWTAEGGIAPLHIDNSGYEFPGGTLCARFAIATGGIQESILAMFEQWVKFQQH